MEKSFLQRLQKVKIKDILSIFLFILAIIPAIIIRLLKKPFWIICDCKDEARDNGFAFFKYMINNQKEQNCYFIIDYKSRDFKKFNVSSKRIINFGSLKHWIYYLACEYNISSQKDGKPNAAICYILEVYGPLKHKTIFLQHGIICNDLPYVHYENSKFAMFITSTQKEFDYVLKNFNYDKNKIKKTGLSRFDELVDLSTDKKYILVMPTWRQWIANSDFKNKNLESSNFLETDYYKTWKEFLDSKELNELLERFDKKLIFYPHRKMQMFINDFSNCINDRIIIANEEEYEVQQLLKECAFLITDYSSVAMDFAYLNKPLFYYQFDIDLFRSNHLTEGYFSYEKDGFGEVIYDKNTLILKLENALKNDLQLEDKYQKRINDFFDIRDNQNSYRIFKAIKELKDEN